MPFDQIQNKKNTKKENIDGSLGDVYAVQKPYSGCQVGKLVTPFSPINGISMDQMPHDQVHGVYPDKDMAMSVANELYEAHCAAEQALEEKKIAVTEKLKKAVTDLEKMRSESMGIIKENPKEAGPHKQKVAELTGKIDELMMKLETIEMSKKQLKNKENKKNLKEEKEYTLGVDKSRAQSPQYFISDSEGNKKYFATKAEAQKALDKKNKK